MKNPKTMVNWEKVKQYRDELFPTVETEVKKELAFLRKVEPLVTLDDYPPTILISLKPKGMYYTSGPSSFFPYEELVPDQRTEISKNLEKISSIVGKIADTHHLRASGGLSRGREDFTYKPGYYTLKPRYREFLT